MIHLLQYFIARCVVLTLELIPYRMVLQVARMGAWAAYTLRPTGRRRSLKYLKMAYGDEMDEKRADEISRASFELIALHVAEASHVRRRIHHKLRIDGEELLKEAYAQGRGVVLVSAHMGCFIRMISLPKLLGIRASVIMREQDNVKLHQWGIDFLKHNFNLDVIKKGKAREEVVERLQAGHLVSFFADHHPRTGGFPGRFFNLGITAPGGSTVYAKRFNCPMFVFTASRQADGTHVLRVDGPISTEGTNEDVTQRSSSSISLGNSHHSKTRGSFTQGTHHPCKSDSSGRRHPR